MKKEIIRITIMGLLITTASTKLNADCSEDFMEGRINGAELSKCFEREQRNAMSDEERKVYDMEKENELKRRQREAEEEKRRLEQEKKNAEYQKKSAFEKVKSWFE